MNLTYIDYHTCGEPVRIVTGGYPPLDAAGILGKRRQAREEHDHLRRAIMLEPRGHAGMYGVIPVASSHPEAAFGVLFTHNEGYSTMCGHATIALGRYAIERGLVAIEEPATRFTIEAPCGLIRLICAVEAGRVGTVSFESVPAFAAMQDLRVEVPGFGSVVTDIAYGGAFYCILPALSLGLDLFETPLMALTEAAAALTEVVRTTQVVSHPDAPELGFLYGTIVTDEARGLEESYNLCIFADRQIDRSPTGSGVTARMALDHAKGLVAAGETRLFRSLTGGRFSGRVVSDAVGPAGAVTVAVAGTSHLAGEGRFIIEPDDPLRHGFALPERLRDSVSG